MTNDKEIYRCPLTPAENPLTISCSGAEYVLNITVIGPQFVEARNVRYNDFSAPRGVAGSIVLMLSLYIGPFDVNFTYISVEEVPCDVGTATGYFSRKDMINWCRHTRENGSGIWSKVTHGNKMGNPEDFDEAGIKDPLSRVTPDGLFINDPSYQWLDGLMQFPNPFGWNEFGINGVVDPVGRFAEDTIDYIELRANGRCRINKLQNEVIRYPTGEVYLNGDKVK